MRSRLRAACRDARGHVVQELLFFTLFYLYLWLVVEPHLIFHGTDRITNFPSFYTTVPFFTSHLTRPGGLVEYLSAFLSQLFYLSWLGALLITLQAWAFALCVATLLRGMGLKALQVVRYVPALLLLVIYGRYTYFFPSTMALLSALALACVYVGLAGRRRPAVGVAFFVVLSLACYYTAGGPFLLFALTCAIHELLLPGRRWLALLYALVAAGLPYVLGVMIFGVSIINAYGDLLPISWRLLYYEARRQGVEVVYALYLLVPVTLLAGGLVSILWARQRSGKIEGARKPKGKHRLPWLAQTVAVVAIGAAVAYGSFDGKKKTCLAVDYFAYHKMWPEVLAEGWKGRDDGFVMHAVNRALYHTGQLGDTMFAWPQEPAYLFLTGTDYRWVYWQSFGAHLELGFVNFAENALMECLEGMGDRPMILQPLALIHMVKGNLGTARVYLRALSTTLFHHAWAKHYLQLLERDPELATDETVQHLRSLAMEQDYPSLGLTKERTLLCLLEKNGRNRMAFEYLMAWYLLNSRLDQFIARLDELRDLGYQELPRHFEEAILVYAAVARTPVQLRGYKPRDEVLRQMKHFVGIIERYGGNKQAAYAELERHYRGTYAFYNAFGRLETK